MSKGDGVLEFVSALAESLGATVGQLTGKEVKAGATIQEDSSSQQQWARAALHSEPSCRAAVGFSTQSGVLLARAMLSEDPGEAASLSPEDQELLAEFWKQALGRASGDLKSILEDCAIDYIDTRVPDWQAAAFAMVTLEWEKGGVNFVVKLSTELVGRVVKDQPESESPAGTVSAATPQANNLDLLLDVPLAVTLRFGQRLMPLREILQLTSGAVVELDRHAEDAVDLLLDDRLIARGQVVVVDGCYGLRVTEVCRSLV